MLGAVDRKIVIIRVFNSAIFNDCAMNKCTDRKIRDPSDYHLAKLAQLPDSRLQCCYFGENNEFQPHSNHQSER
jgi:hypothetical protein